MSVNTTKIIGKVVLPNDTIREKTIVTFRMTGFDTDADDNATVVPWPIDAVVAVDGSIDVDLWPNPEGVRSTFYAVRVSLYNGIRPVDVDLGKIEVPVTGGPYDLNDLLPIAPPAGVSADKYIAQLAAAVASAEAAAEIAVPAATSAQAWAESPTSPGAPGTKSSKTWAGEAEDSAGLAALYDPTLRYKDVDDLLASTRAAAGTGAVWQGGDKLFLEAEPTSEDYHEVTAGGVKLFRKQWLEWLSDLTDVPIVDIPTVSFSNASTVGGSLIEATSALNTDPHFRYDGAISVDQLGAGSGIRKVLGWIYPETLTDSADIEFCFLAGRSDVDGLGTRILIDGKFVALPMARYTGNQGEKYYFRLSFSEAKLRRVRVETEGLLDFVGVYSTTHTVLQRPPGEVNKRMVAIGDSLAEGGPNNYYFRLESHTRIHAALMGCDSYINLGVGGSGWGDNKPDDAFSNRIPPALSVSPHIIFFAGSRNDTGEESQVVSAVLAAMESCLEVPVVMTCGPQQAMFPKLNELVRSGTLAAARTWVDLAGVIPSPGSNPTGHPTYREQLFLALTGFSQTDMADVDSKVSAANFSRTSPRVTLTSSPTSPVGLGTSLTYTAAVSPDTAGSVQFYVDGAVYGTALPVVAGHASITDTPGEGDYAVTARFFPADSTRARTSLSAAISTQVNANVGFVDTFTRPDGALGNSEDTPAKPWTFSTGWVVIGNQAGNPTAGTTTHATFDAGLTNGVYTVTLDGTFEKNVGVSLRSRSNNNHLRFDWSGAGDAPRLRTLISAANVREVLGTPGAWTPGDVLEITLEDENISVSLNGVAVLTATEHQWIGETIFGILTPSSDARFDDVSFVGL